MQRVGEILPDQSTGYREYDVPGQGPAFGGVRDVRDQGSGIDQRVRHDHRLVGGVGLAEEADPEHVPRLLLRRVEDALGNPHQMADISPDRVVALALFTAVAGTQRGRVNQGPRGEAGDGVTQVGRADRRPPDILVPLSGTRQQAPHLGMDEPDPDRQLPAVVLPPQPLGVEDLHLVAIVLPQPPDAPLHHAAGHEERLADGGCKALDQRTRHEGGQDRGGVCVEGPHAGLEALVVDPAGGTVDTLEEVAQRSRRFAQYPGPAVDARGDEPSHVGGRQIGKLLHHRIEFGIADRGVRDVGVGGVRIDRARRGVALDIGRRRSRHHRRSGL